MLATIDVFDYNCDFPHDFATYIFSKKFCGVSGNAWMERAYKHFKQVRRLFCRLERVCGSTSSANGFKANCPLVEMPQLKGITN